MFPVKLADICWNTWVFCCWTLFAMAFFYFEACFPNHSFDWPAILGHSFILPVRFFHPKCLSYLLFQIFLNFTFLASNKKLIRKKSGQLYLGSQGCEVGPFDTYWPKNWVWPFDSFLAPFQDTKVMWVDSRQAGSK